MDIQNHIFFHWFWMLLFTFLWLEYRFKSFLESHVHFKGFMCIRMRKLHEKCQVPADAHNWCQIVFTFNVPKSVSKYLTTKQLLQILGWSVRTLAQYTCIVGRDVIPFNSILLKLILFFIIWLIWVYNVYVRKRWIQIFQALDPHFGLPCAPEPIYSAMTRQLAPSKINRFSQI